MHTKELIYATKANALAIFLILGGAMWTLLVNGAVPFVGMPTMGQAASMLGYAQAFADQHWYSLHARSFGFPVPTSLATGLPLAYVAGWFLRFGLPSADAYSGAVALWLIAGYTGAYRLARVLGSAPAAAALAAASWMTLPMIWAHQSYSSLALGMALLPLYLASAVALFIKSSLSFWRKGCAAAWFVAVCIVALFMDGYTFTMFAVAGSILLAWQVITCRQRWPRIIGMVVPVYLLGYGGAYLLYTAYMGRSAFAPAPLEFFRGWAVDLTFLLKPSQGEFWFWDAVGWSSVRSDAVYFGDASVWLTTFTLPLTLLAVVSLVSVWRRDSRARLLLIIALFGLYMSLGPTLKVEAVKPQGATDPFMQAESGLVTTGNGLLSEHIPGFSAMRASYRWEALYLLGMWGVVVLGISRVDRHRKAQAFVYLLVMVLSAPHLLDIWRDYRSYRRDLATIDRVVTAPLSGKLHPGTKVFFVPFSNDVMANYLSPKLGVVSYNVGGDKQIEIARDRWPANLQGFAMNRFDSSDVGRIRAALLANDASVVIVPYFDSLWAAHLWPCVAEAKGYSARTLALFGTNRGFLCPNQIKAAYASNIDALRRDDFLSVDDQPLFAIVSLRPNYTSEEGRRVGRRRLASSVRYPLDVIADDAASNILGKGWNDREPFNRWSRARSELTIQVPEACQKVDCVARLTLVAFAATPQRPVAVTATAVADSRSALPPVRETWTDEASHVLSVPLPLDASVVTLMIEVPIATSPAQLGLSTDARTLGVSLHNVDVGRP